MAKIEQAAQDMMLQKAGLGTSSKMKAMEVSLDEVRDFGNVDTLTDVVSGIARHNAALKQRAILINESLTKAIPLVRENLYIFAAYTGSGKSSTAANITYPLWQQGKKTLIISNEETRSDIYARIACLHAGIDFKRVKQGEITKDQERAYVQHLPNINKFITVFDATDIRTARLEGVINILEAAKNEDYACILIDYFQLVKYSEADSRKEPYQVMMNFKDYLGAYIKKSNSPVVLFVQLWSLSKRPSKGTELDARLKECSSIQDPASVIIEIVPNFEDEVSDFLICKDRFFGRKGQKLTCPYEKGRFLDAIEDNEILIRSAHNKLNKMTTPPSNTLSAGADYDEGQKNDKH
jgi:KaiC/GvpD/RAD55 family RecA-like ATPase